jgi:hypothetical protein
MHRMAQTVVGKAKLYYITLHLVSYNILAVQLAKSQNIVPCANVRGVCRQAPDVRTEIGLARGLAEMHVASQTERNSLESGVSKSKCT